jgi:hypothetical protein
MTSGFLPQCAFCGSLNGALRDLSCPRTLLLLFLKIRKKSKRGKKFGQVLQLLLL